MVNALLPSVACKLNVAVPRSLFALTSLIPIAVFGDPAWSLVIVLVASNCIRNVLDPTVTNSILTISFLSIGIHSCTIALLFCAPVVPRICLPGINS